MAEILHAAACPVLGTTDPLEFDVNAERGFLPKPDPLDHLPAAFEPLEKIALLLPKLLVAGRVRREVERLPACDMKQLADDRQRRRAMVLLSFMAHAYVWGESEPARRLPAAIAIPWYEVSQLLGRPPVLSYASYALDNWRRLDPSGPIALDNIVLLQDFLGGLDEEWFILVHLDIEAKAAAALQAIISAQRALLEDHPADLTRHLSTIAASLEIMYQTLLRMPERCDPYIYYNRVRPYIHGWKDTPALPDGIIYEGVHAYAGRPQHFRGETGAQSSIVPSLDAALGIVHQEDVLRVYLREMRDYMPPKHRAFIEAIERGPSIRQAVLERRQDKALRDAYNDCIHKLELFRSKHLDYAISYVQRQARDMPTNPADVGTGGTPFIPYLKKHRDETSAHLI
jgi:indoleamine 2,3-dioxygenase